MRGSKLIKKILYYESVDSTNDVARRSAGYGLLVIAERQESGRGRRGRVWISPYGGLWFSIVIRPLHNESHVPLALYNLMAGIAVVEAIRKLGLDAHLKWPNDVIVNNKKVCGILGESMRDRIIIGIGINVNVDLQEFPIDLRGSVTSLMDELGRRVDREDLLVNIIRGVEDICFRFDKDEILTKWKYFDITLNRRVKVFSNGKVIEGFAIDIADDGSLLVVADGGELMKFSSCDVSIR
ncbi:MAG: biotin--[acetyl-CoA-carboxylase] ligase [Nitrososphaerota archaeon]|nr:biotin--[acetyl-CoA-carboxylase] ligase [Nitrososphaerota archaeon]